MFYIIANPTSGRKKSNAKELNQIYDYLNDNKIEYRLFESQYYHHPYEIAKQITSEHESGDLIVIGGDGTFNEVLNGIKDLSKWNIGLIPTGSGNDFAKSINFSFLIDLSTFIHSSLPSPPRVMVLRSFLPHFFSSLAIPLPPFNAPFIRFVIEYLN